MDELQPKDILHPDALADCSDPNNRKLIEPRANQPVTMEELASDPEVTWPRS